jgi:hypothetical protein
MNHNVHVPNHASGLLAVAVANAMERITEPGVAPIVGECMPEPMLVEPQGGAKLRVRVIRWK